MLGRKLKLCIGGIFWLDRFVDRRNKYGSVPMLDFFGSLCEHQRRQMSSIGFFKKKTDYMS